MAICSSGVAESEVSSQAAVRAEDALLSSVTRRRTALTSAAAEDFFARLTSSTDSLTAARAGTR